MSQPHQRSEIMSKPVMHFRATMIALAVAGMAAGQTEGAIKDSTTTTASSTATTTTLTSPGQVRVANKFAAPFTTMAGSTENAVALATALRTGTPVTLTYTTTVDGVTTTTMTTFTPPTKPMGWGNVSHSLALAQFALNQQGIANPTGAQLQAALTGGDITTNDGKTVTLAGVLQQRADGMGWGKIAQSYGTTVGAVNRGIKAPAVATTTATTTTKTATATPKPMVTKSATVTAAGTTSSSSGATTRGLTTAGGTAAGTGPAAKGLTTASGATTSGTSNGIVTADGGSRGNGNAYGRGVVTGSGSAANVAATGGTGNGGSGIVTGAGTTGSGVVSANPGQGGGAGNAHGKGKGG